MKFIELIEQYMEDSRIPPAKVELNINELYILITALKEFHYSEEEEIIVLKQKLEAIKKKMGDEIESDPNYPWKK